MSKRTFSKYSIVRAKKEHRTLEIPEGKLLVVSSCKSSRPMFTSFNIGARLSKNNFEVVSEPYTFGSVVTCIDPTNTLTRGEKYKTYRSEFSSSEVCIHNDNDVLISVLRSRFSL